MPWHVEFVEFYIFVWDGNKMHSRNSVSTFLDKPYLKVLFLSFKQLLPLANIAFQWDFSENKKNNVGLYVVDSNLDVTYHSAFSQPHAKNNHRVDSCLAKPNRDINKCVVVQPVLSPGESVDNQNSFLSVSSPGSTQVIPLPHNRHQQRQRRRRWCSASSTNATQRQLRRERKNMLVNNASDRTQFPRGS